MIKSILKRTGYGTLFSTLPFIMIVVLSALYSEFTPDHWGKLTLITLGVVFWISCKLMPDKYV